MKITGSFANNVGSQSLAENLVRFAQKPSNYQCNTLTLYATDYGDERMGAKQQEWTMKFKGGTSRSQRKMSKEYAKVQRYMCTLMNVNVIFSGLSHPAVSSYYLVSMVA